MRKLLLTSAAVMALGVSTAQAGTLTAAYDVYDFDHVLQDTVTFTGTTESDGTIKLADLSSITITNLGLNTQHQITFTSSGGFQAWPSNGSSGGYIEELISFGTFDSITNTWLADGLNHYGGANAWLYYGNGSLYWTVSSDGVTVVLDSVTEQNPSSVPEPATLALLGASLLGFGLARRRRSKAV